MASMKQKTNKAASKRFSFSASGKPRRRKTRQSHFNARATGDQTRKKHVEAGVSPSDKNRLTRLLPHQ